MRIGSIGFHSYNANLRRIYWLELIDQQMRRAKDSAVKLSLVAPPCEIEARRAPRREDADINFSAAKKA